MRTFSKIFFSFLLLLNLSACNYITYTPRSKRNIRKETPSVLIFERIVDFRVEQMGWPISKMDFMNKGIKYYEVFNDFAYQYTDFKIIDSNKLIFSFSEHIKDIQHFEKTKKKDLNSYGGTVKFFKENNKFIWKLKMHYG